jgi:acetate---CoA ligase (ADP-forming)
MTTNVLTPAEPGGPALHRLDAVFRPKSVAVCGVTNTPGTVPYDLFHNLVSSGFSGPVYPVAPRRKEIAGHRAYDYLLDIPDPVDLAVLVFPGAVCERALLQCVEKEVKAAIVISAGFREVGAAGAAREQRLHSIAALNGLRVVGPNCLGVINTEPGVNLNASFAREMPAAGPIGFISQSGALCTAVLDYAAGRGVGFSKFISLGNKADLDEVDVLRYLANDEQTRVILIYLEDINRGRELMQVAREMTAGATHPKPILAIKGGRTSAGAAAAQSHTGALATSGEICAGVFAQSGIVQCETLEEMFNAAQLLAYQPWPKSNRLAIITNAGGPGVMATDAAVAAGLELPSFSSTTAAGLRQVLPAAASVRNPVDLIGDARAERYADAISIVAADEHVDQLLVILTPQSMTDITAVARTICEMRAHVEQRGKTLACSFMGSKDVAPGIKLLQAHNIPHYILPEWATEALARTWRYQQWRSRESSDFRVFEVDRETAGMVLHSELDGFMLEPEALDVLAAYGLPVPEYELTATEDEALDAAEQLGYPVVLRIVSPAILHKVEAHGVILNIANRKQLRRAFNTLIADVSHVVSRDEIVGVLVRRMIPAGHELILGVNHDPVFGHILMVGLGGTYVEVFKDTSFRVVPLRRTAAGKMLRELRTFSLLTGVRGQRPRDIGAIEEIVQRLSQLVTDYPRIVELDINPLIVHPMGEGATVADVRIRLQQSERAETGLGSAKEYIHG